MLNSFGHSVPVVAGKLQSGGRGSFGKFISTEFTDDKDVLVCDMKEAYHGIPELIASYGIYVGVENVWNMFFGSPLDMASFIDEVGDPLVGAYYDVGNVIAFSWSERWIEVLGNRIHNIHVKDYKRARGVNSGGERKDIPYGDVNWKAVIPALRAAGFDGYLTGEVFKEDPEQSYQDYYAFVARGIEEVMNY